jgi:hypothetical protein
MTHERSEAFRRNTQSIAPPPAFHIVIHAHDARASQAFWRVAVPAIRALVSRGLEQHD